MSRNSPYLQLCGARHWRSGDHSNEKVEGIAQKSRQTPTVSSTRIGPGRIAGVVDTREHPAVKTLGYRVFDLSTVPIWAQYAPLWCPGFCPMPKPLDRVAPPNGESWSPYEFRVARFPHVGLVSQRSTPCRMREHGRICDSIELAAPTYVYPSSAGLPGSINR